MIHLTAIIGSGAKIGTNVEIGPHSIIGDAVTIADDCVIGANVVIEGEVSIGRGNRIGHGAIIGGEPQDVSFSPTTRSRVEIGEGNVIREQCTVHRGTTADSATKIGDENFLMVNAHVGHNCVIGGGSVFHQNMRVGRLVIVQGGSAFGKDIPPFVIAAERNYVFGLNTIGLRRAGFSREQRDEIKSAFKLLYLSGLNTRQALERSREMKWTQPGREFFDSVEKTGKRGICPYRRHGSAED